MLRRRVFSMLATVTAFFTTLIGLGLPQTASAASIYDTTYKSTSTLIQSGYHGCQNQDLTYSWQKYLTNDEYSGLRDSFNIAKSTGRWGVSISYGQVEVFWTEDTSLYLDWTDATYGSGYAVMAKGNNIHRAELSLNGLYSPKPCMPYVSSYWTDAENINVISDKFGYNKNLFTVTDHINSPANYEGADIVTSAPKAQFIAMGDSFSSGEGNDPFEPGTAISGVNQCHRSPQAYPRLLQADTNLNLGPTAFVACAGATMASVLYGGSGAGNWSEGPQVDALSAETEVVTITIGGNDVGFQEYLTICLAHIASCAPNSPTHDAVMDIINSTTFLTNLENVYEKILEKAPNAQVYVIDYPHLTEYDTEYCGLIDLSGGYSIQHALNAKIGTATVNVRFADPDYYDRLHYVNTNAVGSPFSNKHFCSGDEPDFGYTTFHPNTQGHIDYATVVADAIG